MIKECGAIKDDCGHTHHTMCYCQEDQGGGYTYDDEYGKCAFCLDEFVIGNIICADEYNDLRICPVNG